MLQAGRSKVRFPIGVTGFVFGSPNITSISMAMRSTQSLTNEYKESSWGGGGEAWPARKADNQTAICGPVASKMWECGRLTTSWATTACQKDSFAFIFYLFTFNGHPFVT
jgi:hypothetical protein